MFPLPAGMGFGRSRYLNSILFAPGAGYLELSNASWGTYDRAKFAISIWYKKASASDSIYLYNKGGSLTSTTNEEFRLGVSNGGVISFVANQVASQVAFDKTYTNDTNWHHVLLHFDGANGTAGDRAKLWIDGSSVSSFDSYSASTSGSVKTTTNAVRLDAIESGGTPSGGGSNCRIFQPAFFSGSLPDISTVYSATVPLNLSGVTGLYSYLNTVSDPALALEDDYVISTNWTNTGTVAKSTTVPF